jgi:dolichol kinase
MFQNDLYGVIFVYGYVTFLLIITEKYFSKKYPIAGRKILHILVGNIAFILPVFQTREVMAFIAAAPFILLTFLMSPHSPVKRIRGKTSEAGHGMGLVYYAIAWTVLAYFFFDSKEVIAIGIFAMSYGDGLASLLGMKLGMRKYHIFQEEKSFFGSGIMFLFTFLMMIVALVFYEISLSSNMIFVLLGIAGISAVVEGVTPLGLDNLAVPFVIIVLYWIAVSL